MCTRLLWTPAHFTTHSGPRCLVTKLTLTKMFFFELSYEAIWRCAGKRGRDKGIKEIYQTAENEQNATTTKKNGLTYENTLKWAFSSLFWTLIMVTEQQAEGGGRVCSDWWCRLERMFYLPPVYLWSIPIKDAHYFKMSRYKRNSGLIQKRAYVYWHTSIQQERFQLRFILYSAQISN